MKEKKYKKPASMADRKALTIEIKKKGKRIVGFTVWTADKVWVLDGSVMLDEGEEKCRIYTGNRNTRLQFEYKEGTYLEGNYLELKEK